MKCMFMQVLAEAGPAGMRVEENDMKWSKGTRMNCTYVQVLAEAGPAGMRVEEIARRIQKQGLRDLRSSRWVGRSTMAVPL